MRAANSLERSYYLAAQLNNQPHLQNFSSNKKGPIGPCSLLQSKLKQALKPAKLHEQLLHVSRYQAIAP
jgi:hypothetical protein